MTATIPNAELASGDASPLSAGDADAPHLPQAVFFEEAQLSIPSAPEWIAPTVEYLTERAVRCGAVAAERASSVNLALHEALTNSIVHGNLEVSSELKEQDDKAFAEALASRATDPSYAGRLVHVHTTYDGENYCWSLTDEGKGFDVPTVMARAASDDPEVLLASGRGIILMQALLDQVSYHLDGRQVDLIVRRGADERRTHARRPVQKMVRVAPVRPDGSVDWCAAHDALARDFSAGGMALLQSRLANSGRVLIGVDCDGEVVYLPAEVRHCQTLGDGLVQLGCQFRPAEEPVCEPQDLLAGGELNAAVADLMTRADGAIVPPHDRRIHCRVVYTARIGISGGPGPSVGFARNLSKSGIAFLAHQPLTLRHYILSLPRPDQSPLRVRVEIVRCLPLMDGVYEVGARFEGMAN